MNTQKVISTCIILLLAVNCVNAQKIIENQFNVNYVLLPILPLKSEYKTYFIKTTVINNVANNSKNAFCYIGYLQNTNKVFTENQYKKIYTWKWISAQQEFEKKYLGIQGLEKINNEKDADVKINFVLGNINILKNENKQIKNSNNIVIDHYALINYSYTAFIEIRNKQNEIIYKYDVTMPSELFQTEYPEGKMNIDCKSISTHVYLSHVISENAYQKAKQVLQETKPRNKSFEIKLINIESRKEDYNDYNNLLKTFKSGLENFNNGNIIIAQDSLKKSTIGFTEILTNADFNDKKARINSEIAGIISYNLAIAYLLSNNFIKCREFIEKIDGIRKKSVVKSYLTEWNNEAEKRFNINNK